MLSGTRVLMVEDEAMISTMMEDFFESLGCVVVATASRLESAVEKAAGATIDLATLDVNLAGKLSYPVADVLHSRGIPFLFITGYGMKGLPDHLRNAPVLRKPFIVEQLAEMLKIVKASAVF